MKFPLTVGTFAAFVTFSTALAWALPNTTEIIPAKDWAIKITPIYHAAMQIEYGNMVIHIDPISAGDYTGAQKANYILITDSDPDHLDINAVRNLISAEPFGTTVYCPKDVAIQLKPLEAEFDDNVKVETFKSDPGNGLGNDSVGSENWDIEAQPAYNIVRGPKPGEKYHMRGKCNGYVLTLGGKRIYIAGDTEVTPEMKALKNIDIAFLPMNLPFTMTPQEAAAGARAFKPKVVYPYHYRYPFDQPNDNPQQFQKALAGSGIQVRIRGWYAHPAAK